MKTITKLFLLCSFIYFLNANAQAPNKFSFQAVVRNTSSQLITNQSVGVKISIISVVMGTENAEFEETHTVTTNANGLFSLKVGDGTLVSGDFTTAMSSNAQSKKIKCEIDPTGGTNYTIISNEQLLSVPYALNANNATYANNANSATTADTATTANSVNGIAGTEGYVPVFGANNAIGNSNLFKDPNTGQIGLNTISPQATFHIKDSYPSIILSDFGVNKLAANFDLYGNANFGTGSASKLRLITNDVSRLEIAANGEIDVKTNLKIGNNGRRIGGVEFQTSTIGTNASNSKTVHITLFNGAMPTTNYVVLITQVNSNESDTFHFIVKNKSLYGFDIFIKRTDTNDGWGQNLQIDYAVLSGAY